VFVTSDGISDNFDPVVGKFCVPKKPERQGSANVANSKSSQQVLLPKVSTVAQGCQIFLTQYTKAGENIPNYH
jgi:hypothetical protein